MKTLLVSLSIFSSIAYAAPQGQEDKYIVHIPVKATDPSQVRTLQQHMKIGLEDEQNVEVPIELESLDDLDRLLAKDARKQKTEELKAKVESRIMTRPSSVIRAEEHRALISSNNPASLDLTPASRLNGRPGEKVNVEFSLTNFGARNYFTTLAREFDAGGVEGVNFPGSNVPFLTALSELKPFLENNETRPVVLTLQIPNDAPLGTRRVITLEVQPHGNNVAGSANTMTRRFVFTVLAEGENPWNDEEKPECKIEAESYESQCGLNRDDENCQLRRFTANFKIKVSLLLNSYDVA